MREDSPESSRVRIAYPSDFGMYTETKLLIAVPSSTVANYDPRGIGSDPTVQTMWTRRFI
jgi:hypothetical protein